MSLSHHTRIGYQNPWPSASASSLYELACKFILEYASPLKEDGKEGVRQVRVVKPDFGEARSGEEVMTTWLGHSGFLAQLPIPNQSTRRPLRLLFDPIFSERSSPTQYFGPKRRLQTPCKVSDLPDVDFLCISHNHYDHLDTQTIYEIEKRWKGTIRYMVPMGNKAWFVSCGIDPLRIYELDWWQEATFTEDDLQLEISDNLRGPTDGGFDLKISCVPAQHSSGRWLTDQYRTLWCGWTVQQTLRGAEKNPSGPAQEKSCSVYFAGDTGYRPSLDGPTCPVFKQIGDKYGPFDISMIPIWRGGSLSFISYFGLRLPKEALTTSHHTSPSDSVDLHLDVRSRNSIACHFATFCGSEYEALEPLVLLKDACEGKGVGFGVRYGGEVGEGEGEGQRGKGRFGWLDVGGTFGVRPGERDERS